MQINDQDGGRWSAEVSMPLRCLLCDATIRAFWDSSNGGFWSYLDDATEISIQPGYGSTLDGDNFRAYLCDRCLRQAAINNRVVWLGNWLMDHPESGLELGHYPDWEKEGEEKEEGE
ncbi:MAG: hypothetical protein FJY85_16855 [Deltaproteobacteria bacterium]|nr:hypothetical protein [Deltaproteobacteria bacterium]